MNLYIPRHAGHNPPRNANTLRRFGSLNNVADMPHFSRGFFVSAILFCSLFLWAVKGRRLYACWTRYQSSNRLFAVRQRLEAQANIFLNVKKEAL